MRKLNLCCLLLIIFLLPGCTFNKPEYIKNDTKPSNSFYTNEIYSKLKIEEEFTLEVFNCDLYKYYEVKKDDLDIIQDFIESLHTENFHEEFSEDQKNLIPKYKMILTFKNSKFIFNIFDNNLCTIYPWDGVFKEDIISFENVPKHSNLYEFCIYIENLNKE